MKYTGAARGPGCYLSTMTRRTYQQFCGLAYTLDAVGERWTLLIVRELMTAPRRYSDLATALPGIGTSLLAARLKQLEADGLLRRILQEPPHVAVAYELTVAGRELGRALEPLARWGARHRMTDRAPEELFRVDWSLTFLAEVADPALTAGADLTCDVVVDDQTARLRLRDGRITLDTPDGRAADAILRTDTTTFAAIAGGRMDIPDAIGQDLVRADGDPAALATVAAVVHAATRAP